MTQSRLVLREGAVDHGLIGGDQEGIARRCGARQLEKQPEDVIADLQDAFAQAKVLRAANAAG
jgi:hypothetical protein